MEYSLTGIICGSFAIYNSLNPYSNGILSDLCRQTVVSMFVRLNPYSNGILSDIDIHTI